MIDLGERTRLLQELVVAEVLARRGQGPLARRVPARPRMRDVVRNAARALPSAPSETRAEPASAKPSDDET